MWFAVVLFFFFCLGEVTLQTCRTTALLLRKSSKTEGLFHAPCLSALKTKPPSQSCWVFKSIRFDQNKQLILPSWEGRATCTITRVLLTLNFARLDFVDGVRCWASRRRGGNFFTSEVGTLLLNLFKWFTRQLSLHGLLPNDVPHKKPRRNAMMHNPVLIHIQQDLKKKKKNIIAQITGWGRGSALKNTPQRTRRCGSEHCSHQQHADDSAEVILLHLNMNKAIFESPINVSLSQAGYSGPGASDFIFWW